MKSPCLIVMILQSMSCRLSNILTNLLTCRRGNRYFSEVDFPISSEAVAQAVLKSWSRNSHSLATNDTSESDPTDLTTASNADESSVEAAASRKGSKLPNAAHEVPSSPLSATPITSEVTPKPHDHSPATTLGEQPAALPNSPDSVKFGASATSPAVAVAPHSKRSGHKDADGDISLHDANAGADTLAQGKQDSHPHPELSTVRSPATPVPAHDRGQRMQTRVSSGAMRQKSVAEIMHETPKTATRKKAPGLLRDASSMSQSPRTTPSRAARDSMPAPPRPPRLSFSISAISNRRESTLPFDLDAFSNLIGAADDPNRDYLEPLYRIQAQDPPNGRSLMELVHKASKSVSTNDQLVCYKERQDHRILKRIYGLQYANHWSLRQMQPCPEPPAPKTHWDHVIAEAKWMRTDFRQERKEKKALAEFLAQRCAEWVAADTAGRLLLQVKTKQPQPLEAPSEVAEEPQSPAATHVGNADNKDDNEDPVPELESSNKDDHSSPETDLESPATPHFAIVPETMFSALNLGEDTAHLLESEDFIRIVNGLPLYAPFSDEDGPAPSTTKLVSHATPSVSKFSSNKIVT